VTVTARTRRGDGVGVVDGGWGVVAEFGVLVDDDDERGLGRVGLPDSLPGVGQPGGAGVQDGHGVGE